MSDTGKPVTQPLPKRLTQHEERALALLADLWSDPSDLGRGVRAAAKKKFDDIPEPVGDVRAEMADMKKTIDDLNKRIADRDKANDDLRLEADLAGRIHAAVQEFGLTDSGRAKMLDRMKETGNVHDAAAAAAWVVSQLPKPQTSDLPSWMPQKANTYGFAEKEDKWESLHRDPVKYLDNELRDFVRDPDGYTRDTFGTA